jgi:glycosyltransferase involved in cell wall biosynthesis
MGNGLRIGLNYDLFQRWQGGIDLFRMMVNCLELGQSPDDEIAVIARRQRDALPWRVLRVARHLLTTFPYDRRWISHELTRVPQRKFMRETIGEGATLALYSIAGSQAFQTLSAFDVIGPFYAPPSLSGGQSWIGYLPDCQHKHLPHFFSAAECAERDIQYTQLLQTAPVVIVNSHDAKADLMRFFAPTRAEIIVLPFAASADRKWFDINVGKVREKYQLPREYFLCSNQFWQHKNHVVVLDALALAKSAGTPFCVVFTGEMDDYRSPDYAGSLVARVQKLGIADACHFLGLIPKLDQIALMREAIAVIQPTLFEGGPGGGAVYAAIGLGQPVIVSDISVNREIAEYVDEYFAPDDPKALLACMCRAMDKARPKRDRASLLREGRDRSRHCGTVLRSAFALAVERSQRSWITNPSSAI